MAIVCQLSQAVPAAIALCSKVNANILIKQADLTVIFSKIKQKNAAVNLTVALAFSVHMNIHLWEREVDAGFWKFVVEPRVHVKVDIPIKTCRSPYADNDVNTACRERA